MARERSSGLALGRHSLALLRALSRNICFKSRTHRHDGPLADPNVFANVDPEPRGKPHHGSSVGPGNWRRVFANVEYPGIALHRLDHFACNLNSRPTGDHVDAREGVANAPVDCISIRTGSVCAHHRGRCHQDERTPDPSTIEVGWLGDTRFTLGEVVEMVNERGSLLGDFVRRRAVRQAHPELCEFL